jgi:CheY-like chemotaxis protein
MKSKSRLESAGCTEVPEVIAVTVKPSQRPRQRVMQRKSILVVDDEPGVLAVLREVLSEDGYAVDTAADGQEALKKLQELVFDVIICDIRMPKMDGITFYRAIAQQEPDLLARWIFLTADILNPKTHDFLQQVATPILEKPFEIRRVREVVRRVLQASERS